MPHASSNIVASWTRAKFSCVTADDLVPFVCLEMPHALREEACSDQVEQAGWDEEEVLDRRDVTPPIMALALSHDR